MANDISFSDYLALSRITFEWADSYDSKVTNLFSSSFSLPTIYIVFFYFHFH